MRRHIFEYYMPNYANTYEIMPEYTFVCLYIYEYASVFEHLSKHPKIC